MKKLIIAIICILIAHTLHAQLQLSDTVLIESYGQVRADMVKTVCQIVGYSDSSALNAITTESLTEFKRRIVGNDTLSRIVSTAKPLSGVNVDVYNNSLNETRKSFKQNLEKFFPEKEAEIDSQFNKYISVIENLTKECLAFNEDTTQLKSNYQSSYHKGRFVGLISRSENNKFQRTASQETIDGSVSDNSKSQNMFSKFFMGILAAIWFIVKLGVILLAILIIYLKRRRIAFYVRQLFNKKHSNNVNNYPGNNRYNQAQGHLGPEGGTIGQHGACTNPPEEHPQSVHGSGTQIPTPPPYPGPQKEEPSFGTENSVQKNEGDDVVGGNGENQPPVEAPQKEPQQIDTREKKTAVDAGEWIIVGASVQGNGHIKMNLPCQDSHGYENLGDGWGIAVTADGAGSAKLSHIGATVAVSRAIEHFRNLVLKEQWIVNAQLPSDNDWMKYAYRTLKMVRDDISAFAGKNKVDVKDFSSTIIVFIHSPYGALVTHIGDGRAGYKDMKGEWHAAITPHKGEEANQTIFIPSEFWNIPFYEMSGATVPESRVIRDQLSAFTLMSDGCENTSWSYNHYDDASGKFYDPNLPYPKFFNPLLETLQSFRTENIPIEEREERWFDFIQSGHKSFVKESDDKTMILGALYM